MNRLLVMFSAIAIAAPLAAQVPEPPQQPLPEETRTDEQAQDGSTAAPELLPNTLYMNDYSKGSRGSLYFLDAATGAVGIVGRTGMKDVTDIAFKGPTLYGVTFDTFVRINPSTGKAVRIGSIGSSDVNALAHNPGDGKLYAAGSKAPGYFLQIDLTTGKGRVIGSYGSGLGSAGDIVFKGGVCYATVNKSGSGTTWLVRVDVATGKATLIGDTHFMDVWGLALRSGTIYGVTHDGKFLRINTKTGAGTQIGGKNFIPQAGLTTSLSSAALRRFRRFQERR